MKLPVRRIGNSLGVIIPKKTLDDWGVGEGGHLELGERAIRPIAAAASSHEALDELKRKLAVEVVSRYAPALIRAHSLGNLHRWRQNGVWGPAYGEWEEILKSPDDGKLFSVMLGRDDRSNRLRQSPPYVGLLPRDRVKKLNEEATA